MSSAHPPPAPPPRPHAGDAPLPRSLSLPPLTPDAPRPSLLLLLRPPLPPPPCGRPAENVWRRGGEPFCTWRSGLHSFYDAPARPRPRTAPPRLVRAASPALARLSPPPPPLSPSARPPSPTAASAAPTKKKKKKKVDFAPSGNRNRGSAMGRLNVTTTNGAGKPREAARRQRNGY